MGLFDKKKRDVEVKEEARVNSGVVEVGRKSKELNVPVEPLLPPLPPKVEEAVEVPVSISKEEEGEVFVEKEVVEEKVNAEEEAVELATYFRENYGKIGTDAGLDTTNSLLFGIFSEIVKLRADLVKLEER